MSVMLREEQGHIGVEVKGIEELEEFATGINGLVNELRSDPAVNRTRLTGAIALREQVGKDLHDTQDGILDKSGLFSYGVEEKEVVIAALDIAAKKKEAEEKIVESEGDFSWLSNPTSKTVAYNGRFAPKEAKEQARRSLLPHEEVE